MSEITLVRMPSAEIPQPDREAARRVLFGAIDGLGEKGKKQWRRFVNGLFNLEPGEMVEIVTHKARSGPFHRRHMALEQRVFESQERIADFPQFRLWLKLGAGHVDWMPGVRGGVVPVPRSIAYSKLEDGEMREFHDAVVAFLRTPHAQKYLWPALPAMQADAAIEAVLAEFER
ncbi:conserved protein of unknown function, phage related [Ralstonia solanacearum CMR15]|nr:conserved protein of unknown function, phage related [Ralstonia solanacearum CMR15]